MTRIAVLDDYQRVAATSADWSPILDRATVDLWDQHLDEDQVAAALQGFDVVVAMRERTPFPASLLTRLPDLRLLVTTGMANKSIDLEACRAAGVTVAGTGGWAPATPELTWGLLLALARQVPTADADVRAGRWQTTIGTGLSGRTLGLLGLGRIGAVVARYAHAFDMTVLAWSQHLTAERANEHGAELVSRQELFDRSDAVSIHLQLSDRTRGLVGPAELAGLGPAGYLVNTSRGPIVEERALIDALHSATIAGAALDVFDQEPLPSDHPLRRAPRTVVTPHLGYVTTESYTRFYTEVVEDIDAWLRGSPIRLLGT